MPNTAYTPMQWVSLSEVPPPEPYQDQINISEHWPNTNPYYGIQQHLQDQAQMVQKTTANKQSSLYPDFPIMPKEGRSASQLSDEYQALTEQLKALTTSIHQEQEELANVLEGIAKKVEVVRDIGTLVQQRITNLLQVATQLEVMRLTLRLPDSPQIGQALSAGQTARPLERPFAEALKGRSGLGF